MTKRKYPSKGRGPAKIKSTPAAAVNSTAERKERPESESTDAVDEEETPGEIDMMRLVTFGQTAYSPLADGNSASAQHAEGPNNVTRADRGSHGDARTL
jgi:hypothetical protein